LAEKLAARRDGAQQDTGPVDPKKKGGAPPPVPKKEEPPKKEAPPVKGAKGGPTQEELEAEAEKLRKEAAEAER
jgi:hypothetical protein